MVPDVTGTKQHTVHTEQMFVWTSGHLQQQQNNLGQQNETLNMKGHQKRPIYVQITVSLRLCRALLSTNGQGKPRRPGGLESDSRCCRGGFQGRVALENNGEKTGAKILRKVRVVTVEKKQMAVGDLI